MILMRIMILITLLACVSLVPSLGRAAEARLPIVFEEYPPYEYIEDGMIKGMNMDIIREAFKRMGIKPTFEPRPWKRALFELKAGEILALSSGFRTKDREHFVVYPDAPLGMETNVIITTVNRDIEVRSLDDLKGLNLGVVREYVYGEPFDSMHGLNKIKAQSSHQLLRMLLNGRMDVAIGNKAVFRYLARQQNALDRIKVLYEVGSEPLYLMFSKERGPKAENLARDFGNAVKGMIKDGSFQRIVDSY